MPRSGRQAAGGAHSIPNMNTSDPSTSTPTQFSARRRARASDRIPGGQRASRRVLQFVRASLRVAALAAAGLLLAPEPAQAGSATWLAAAGSGDWNIGTNWTAGGPPKGAGDTATFGFSSITSLTLSADTEVNSILFGTG